MRTFELLLWGAITRAPARQELPKKNARFPRHGAMNGRQKSRGSHRLRLAAHGHAVCSTAGREPSPPRGRGRSPILDDPPRPERAQASGGLVSPQWRRCLTFPVKTAIRPRIARGSSPVRIRATVRTCGHCSATIRDVATGVLPLARTARHSTFESAGIPVVYHPLTTTRSGSWTKAAAQGELLDYSSNHSSWGSNLGIATMRTCILPIAE